MNKSDRRNRGEEVAEREGCVGTEMKRLWSVGEMPRDKIKHGCAMAERLLLTAKEARGRLNSLNQVLRQLFVLLACFIQTLVVIR